MAFDTPLMRMFAMRHPIMLGGLMWLSDAAIVAAVVNAGGMGFITARSFPSVARFRDELRRCRELTAGRPFGVNLTLSLRHKADYTMREMLDCALDEGVRHFETAGVSPDALIEPLHAGGGVLMHKCAHVRHALAAERLGVDAIGLVGLEEGGHPGSNQLPTFVNGAFALQKLKIPLALGGGIGHGRQIAAALALGAQAVVVGSRFTVASEIWAHEAYKQRVVDCDEHASVTVLASLNDSWRVMDNRVSREVRRLEREGARTHADFGDLILGVRTRDRVYVEGNPDEGMLSLGPSAGFADRICPAAEIVGQLVMEMEEAVAAFARARGGQ